MEVIVLFESEQVYTTNSLIDAIKFIDDESSNSRGGINVYLFERHDLILKQGDIFIRLNQSQIERLYQDYVNSLSK